MVDGLASGGILLQASRQLPKFQLRSFSQLNLRPVRILFLLLLEIHIAFQWAQVPTTYNERLQVESEPALQVRERENSAGCLLCSFGHQLKLGTYKSISQCQAITQVSQRRWESSDSIHFSASALWSPDAGLYWTFLRAEPKQSYLPGRHNTYCTVLFGKIAFLEVGGMCFKQFKK